MSSFRTFDNLIKECSRELADPSNIGYSLEDIRTWINDGQSEMNRLAKLLVARAPIVQRENQSIFNFPDDIQFPQWLENKDGKIIQASHSHYLQEAVGSNYRSKTCTGNPTHWYSDLVGKGQFELYPKSDDQFDQDPLEVVTGDLVGLRSDGLTEDIIAIETEATKIYILTANKYYVYKKVGLRVTKETEVTHSLALTYSSTVTGPFRIVKHSTVFSSESTPGAPGTAFIVNGADMVRIDPNGTVTPFGTAASNIMHIFDFEFHNPDKVYFQTDDFKIYKTSSFSTFTTTLLSTETTIAIDSTGNFEDRNVYFSLGTPGVKKIITTTDTVPLTALTTNSAGGIGALATDGNPIYFVDYTDSVIKKIVPATDTITDTEQSMSMAFSSVGHPFSTNDLDRFWYFDEESTSSPQTLNFFQEIVADVKTRTLYSSDSRSSVSTLLRRYSASKEDLFGVSTSMVTLVISAFDRGAVVNVDDILFDCEEGVVVDIEDDSDVFNFSSEEGSISEVVVSELVANVNYVRCPRIGVVEGFPSYAIIEYVKYRAKKRDGNTRSTAQSVFHKAEFDRYVGLLQAEVANGHAPGSRGVKTVNY